MTMVGIANAAQWAYTVPTSNNALWEADPMSG